MLMYYHYKTHQTLMVQMLIYHSGQEILIMQLLNMEEYKLMLQRHRQTALRKDIWLSGLIVLHQWVKECASMALVKLVLE